MDTFPAIKPSYTSQVEQGDKLVIAEFGDGYRQRSPDGINNRRLRLSVLFSERKSTTIAAVKTFLDAHPGHVPWLWTPPAPFATARQWTLIPPAIYTWNGYDNESVAFVIEEDFNPAAP